MNNNLQKFIEYLEIQKNYSNHTVVAYQKDIEEFLSFLNTKKTSYLKIEYNDIRLYLQDIENLAKSSISRKISSLKSFYRYLSRNKIIDNNPFLLINLPRPNQKIPKFLYINELEELFNSFDLNTTNGIRDRLIIELLYATGVRVSELVNIKIEDININDKTIKVLGKGNKERMVLFGDYAKDILNLYLLETRIKLLKNKQSNYLFINHCGTKLTDRGVRLIIDKAIKNTSIKTKISPHSLRHTFATHLLNEGCDILSVQELLGHASLRATQIYTHITDDHLKSVYLKCHPRNIKK